MTDSAPVRVVVIRHQCPHCRRTHSKKTAAVAHIARCWKNPANRTCKTCAYFDQGGDACGCESGCNWGSPGPLPPSCDATGEYLGDKVPVVHCPLWTVHPHA